MEPITIRYTFRPRQRSLITGQVADLFGLSAEEPPHVIGDNVQLGIRPGDLVLFTGPSGSGKSSLLRAAGQQLQAVDAASIALPDRPLVDCLNGPVETRLDRLAACGLSEARLLLRTPDELSDGQRYRFRLAYSLDKVGPQGGFLAADEFCAQLDRTLAKVLAFNVRKLCTRAGVGFLLATTHDDLLEDLNPDVWVRCPGDGAIVVERRDVKKKLSHSRTTFGCRKAPAVIGRISLGGITAVITSRSRSASHSSGIGKSRSAFACSALLPRR